MTKPQQLTPEFKQIDLTDRQRAIVAAIQTDQAKLDALRAQEQELLARINSNRGKLELIFELAAEYGDQHSNQEETSVNRTNPAA